MKKQTNQRRKLELRSEQIKQLSTQTLARVAGGNEAGPEPWSGNMSCVISGCCASEWCTCEIPSCL